MLIHYVEILSKLSQYIDDLEGSNRRTLALDILCCIFENLNLLTRDGRNGSNTVDIKESYFIGEHDEFPKKILSELQSIQETLFKNLGPNSHHRDFVRSFYSVYFRTIVALTNLHFKGQAIGDQDIHTLHMMRPEDTPYKYRRKFNEPFVLKTSVNIQDIEQIISTATFDYPIHTLLADFPSKYPDKYVTYSYPLDYLSQVNYAVNLKIDALSDFFESNFGTLARDFFGTNYTIANIWVYETMLINGQQTFNLNSNWHVDGDLSPSLKILIYLSEVSTGAGPFAYIDPDSKSIVTVLGGPGTAICFSSWNVMHQAQNVINKNRLAISFLIYPSYTKGTSFNSSQPFNAQIPSNFIL